MNFREYRAAIATLGMTASSAAAFFGVVPRQSRRWAAGDANIPAPVGLLLRYMLAVGLTPADVHAAILKGKANR